MRAMSERINGCGRERSKVIEMDLFIKLVMLIIFFGVMIVIGLYCRKHATDVNGFVLGGRNVGPWLTAFAYGTSYFSAVVFVGYAGQFGWKYGIAATWAGLGNAFLGSLLAWAVLGRRTRIMTQHLNSATMPEFFGQRFESKPLKLAASAIIFIFLIPYTASLYNGLSRLFGMAFEIDYSVCVIVMAVLTGIYVIAGGYMATAINDFIQGIIMIFGIVAVIIAVLNSQGGFLSALDKLSAKYVLKYTAERDMFMAKRRTKTFIEDIFNGCASVNECTGLYQKVSLDTDEVEEFHKQYTEDDE